jgi:hypothetical protein
LLIAQLLKVVIVIGMLSKGNWIGGGGLDSSGLSFLAFNKAAGATKHQDPANPICYE